MEKQGVADDDRDCHHRDDGELYVHRNHERKRERQKDTDAHHVHELIGNEAAHGVYIRCAALDDIAGLVFHMPGKRQALDVRKEQVSDAAGKGFRRLCNGNHVDIAEHTREECNQHYAHRDQEQIRFQRRNAADRFHCRCNRSGNAERFGADDAVHGEPDELRCDHLREGDHQRGRHRQRVITLAALEEHEEQAGTAHLFLLFCLHNSSHIACPHSEPDPPPSNTANI